MNNNANNMDLQSYFRGMAALRERTHSMLGGFRHPGPRSSMATITAVYADTLSVKIGNTGSDITVIKPTKVCPALDQDVDGYTYAYTTSGKQTRTSTSGGNTETQMVVPLFIVGDVVEIGPAPAGIATYAPSLSGVKFQVVNSPAYWSKVSST